MSRLACVSKDARKAGVGNAVLVRFETFFFMHESVSQILIYENLLTDQKPQIQYYHVDLNYTDNSMHP